jgi:hypothetical protein
MIDGWRFYKSDECSRPVVGSKWLFRVCQAALKMVYYWSHETDFAEKWGTPTFLVVTIVIVGRARWHNRTRRV